MRSPLWRVQTYNDITPLGWGVAYSVHAEDYAGLEEYHEVVCPVPLHLVVALARQIWQWLRCRAQSSYVDRMWNAGYKAGREAQRQDWADMAQEHFERMVDSPLPPVRNL